MSSSSVLIVGDSFVRRLNQNRSIYCRQSLNMIGRGGYTARRMLTEGYLNQILEHQPADILILLSEYKLYLFYIHIELYLFYFLI